MRLLPHQLLLLLLGSTFCSSSSLSAPQLCLLPLGLPSAAFEPFLEPGPTHLDVGGEPVSLLDELGPLVVSKDGVRPVPARARGVAPALTRTADAREDQHLGHDG